MPKKPQRIKELIERRSANAKHYLRDDGLVECVIIARPQHYRDKDGKWQDIRPRLRGENREVAPKGKLRRLFELVCDEAPYTYLLARRADKVFRMEYEDGVLEWSFPGANKVQGQPGEDVIEYPEAFPFAVLRYKAQDIGVKEEIILQPGATNFFTVRFETEALVPAQAPNGAIRWVDILSGKTKLVTQAPFAEDAAGARVDMGTVFRAVDDGWEVDYIIPPAWLEDEARQWPVVVDPTVKIEFSAIEDAHVLQSDPDNNYGSGESLYIDNSNNSDIYIKADLGSIPSGSIVESAVLTVYVYNTFEYGNAWAYRVTEDWQENTITWNNKPADTGTKFGEMLISSGYQTLDITNLVQDWVNGTYSNYGLVLKSYDAKAWLHSSEYSYNGESRLYITVTYNAKPTVTPTDPTGTSQEPEIINTVMPRLTWTYYDPEDTQASYQVIIKRASDNVTILDTGEVSSANQYYDVPAATLAEGVKYYWVVRVKDATGLWSDWSTAQYFYTNRAPSATPTNPTGTSESPEIIQNSITPTLDWNYSDPDGHTQASYQVIVKRASDNATIIDTGEVASSNTSYTVPDATLSYGTVYYWQVRVKDAYGRWSGYSTAQYFEPNQTAGTPTNLSPGGTDAEPTWITTLTPRLSWTHTDPDSDPQSAFQVQIYDGANLVHDSGEITSSNQYYDVPAGILDESKEYNWKVRTKDSGSGLFGSYASPVYFYTNAAPTTPTNLDPGTSEVFDATSDEVFSWQFNDPDTGAGDAQTAFQIIIVRVSDGVTVHDTGKVVSATESYTLPGGTLANGESYQWKVRAWDSQDQAGSYSNLASFECSLPPAVSITSPIDSGTYPKGILTVTWSYSDPDTSPQTKFQVILKNADGSQILKDSGEVSGTDTEYTFSTVLDNNTTYQVQVTVWDNVGLSSSDTHTFTTDFVPPTTPVISALGYDDGAKIIITITNPDDDPAKPATDHNDLYRRESGGEWIRIVKDLPINAGYEDFAVASGRTYEYKAIAISVDETSAESNVAEATISFEGIWIHSIYDPASTLLNIPYNKDIRTKWTPERTLMQYEGRTRPAVEYGTFETFTYEVTLTLDKEETWWEDLQSLVHGKETLCFRDYRGRKIFGTPQDLSETQLNFGNEVSLVIDEIDYSEEV